MHDSVDVTVVWGDDESEGCFALYGAVNKFGVSHDFVVEEWDFLIVSDKMIPGLVLDRGSNIDMNRSLE